MNWRLYFGVLGLCLVAIVLTVRVAEWLYPPTPPVLIDGGGTAFTAQFRPKAKPIIISPAPRPRAAPKHHRLKTNIEPFRRFEFDQRTIV